MEAYNGDAVPRSPIPAIVVAESFKNIIIDDKEIYDGIKVVDVRQAYIEYLEIHPYDGNMAHQACILIDEEVFNSLLKAPPLSDEVGFNEYFIKLVDPLDDWKEVHDEYRGWVKSDLRSIRWMHRIMGYTLGWPLGQSRGRMEIFGLIRREEDASSADGEPSTKKTGQQSCKEPSV